MDLGTILKAAVEKEIFLGCSLHFQPNLRDEWVILYLRVFTMHRAVDSD